jgi:uncharacterized membrane protein YgaE (UPF0421/DUF939 family)
MNVRRRIIYFYKYIDIYTQQKREHEIAAKLTREKAHMQLQSIMDMQDAKLEQVYIYTRAHVHTHTHTHTHTHIHTECSALVQFLTCILLLTFSNASDMYPPPHILKNRSGH